ncbi:hypothetical protein Scep_027416 [Stephania cephalantha]|uniref:Uncharacterized protein n=1 Tax=Stephania cephalantha TaxID=152367 RepID=A0AAP0HIH4_9MAGN
MIGFTTSTGYVTKYFKNNILFREIFLGKTFQVAGKGVCIIFMYVILSFQALDGAFNVFCNENVGNISSAKMLAASCQDILKRGREELVIETVEKTLKKASISKARMENMKAVLTLAENMQINFEEYLNLNPQKQSKQYLSFVDFLAYGLKLIIGFSSCCHRTVHLSCHRSYSVGFLQDTINLSEFLTYIALVGILNSIQQSKAIKKGNQWYASSLDLTSDYRNLREDNMELLYVLHGQEGGITHVQFSRDGNYLYTGSRRVGFVDKLQRRRQELTQTTPDQPVDDEAVYYKVAGDCPKGCVYSLRSLWRKKRRYVDPDASTSQVLAQMRMGNFMILSKGSETELLYSVSDPLLIRDGSETEYNNSVSDPLLIRYGSETEYNNSVSD